MFITVTIIIRAKETTAVPYVCVKPGLDASWPGGSRMAGLTPGGPLVAGRKLFGPTWLDSVRPQKPSISLPLRKEFSTAGITSNKQKKTGWKPSEMNQQGRGDAAPEKGGEDAQPEK